jgi:hypothetical protein
MSTFLASIAVAGAAPVTGADASGFTVHVSAPVLIDNAVVAVTVSCPASQSKCGGATAAYVPPEPNSRAPALRRGLLIAPAQPFKLKRGQSMTLRLPIPLSEIPIFRQLHSVVIWTYTLAGNPDTKGTAAVFQLGTVTLAPHDRRLYNLKRLRLRLVRLQLKRNENRLTLTVHCTGASAQAKASVYGGCEGIIGVFGGTLSAAVPRVEPIGGQVFVLKANTTLNLSIRLLKGRLTHIAHEAQPYLVVYSIASDRVDKLGAAQLVRLRFRHT